MSRFSYKTLILILLFLLIPIVLFLRISQNNKDVYAEWWDETWMYRQSINISSHTSDETDVYITATISLSSTDKAQTDAGDFRFLNSSGQILPYYIVSGAGTTSITFHINLDSFPAGAQTLYAYYGNPSATNGFSASDFSTEASNYTLGSQGSEEIGGGPIAYWSLDEGVGTTTYDSVDSSPASLQIGASAPSWVNEDKCIAGKCLDFKGSNNYVYPASVSKLNNLEIFTLSAWVNMRNRKYIPTIINKGPETNAQHIWWGIQNNNQIWLELGDSAGYSTYKSSALSWDLNKWYYLAVSVNNETKEVKHYRDGKLINTLSFSGRDFNSGTYALSIGRYYSNSPTNYDWDGFIDEVKIFPYARTESQIKSDYAAGLVGMSSSSDSSVNIGGASAKFLSHGLVGYWKFDESSGNATDSSGNNNNATVSGSSNYTSGKYGNSFRAGIGATNLIANPSFEVDLTNWNTYKTTKVQTTTQAVFGTQALQIGASDPEGNAQVYYYVTANTDVGTSYTFSVYLSGTGTVVLSTYDNVSSYQDGSSITLTSVPVRHSIIRTFGTGSTDRRVVIRGFDQLTDTAFVDAAQLELYTTSGTSFNGYATPYFDGSTGFGNTWSGTEHASISFRASSTGNVANSSSIDIGTTQISLGAWVYLNKIPQSNAVVMQKSGYTAGYRIMIKNNGTVHVGIGETGGGYTSSNNSLSLNKWHHIFSTYDGTNIRIYINGQLDKTQPYSNPLVNTTSLLYFGSTEYPPIDGYVDEVRIYNRALSPTEVKQLYDYAPGPIAYWKFEEGVGTTAFDSSGNNNHGVWQGTLGNQWTVGKIGTAGNYNGTNNYVNFGDINEIDNASALTVGLWLKPNNNGTSWGGYLSKVTAYPYNGFMLQRYGTENNRLYLRGWGNENSGVNIYITDNQWNYISFTWDGTTVTTYVNGQKKEIWNPTNKILDASTSTLNAGQGTLGYRSGLIDEVKIYNYARTQKQILEDMNAGAPATSARGGPLIHYKFDEGNGTNSTNWGIGSTTYKLNFGAGDSAPSWSSNSKIGKSLRFDGTNYGDPSTYYLAQFSDHTYTAWFNLDTSEAGSTYEHPIFGSHQYSGVVDYIPSSKTFRHYRQFSTGGQTVSWPVSYQYADGKWHHLAMAIDQTTFTVKLYLDGKYIDTKSITAEGYTHSNGAFRHVGKNYGRFWTGYLDELKVYPYTLTADEVKQDYNQGSTFVFGTSNQTIGATTTSLGYCVPGDTSPCSPPVAEWKFEEGVGTTAYDTSGNNCHVGFGTGSGAPLWDSNSKVGTGLNFTTEFQYLPGQTCNNQSFSTAFTAEAWVKKSTAGTGYDWIINKGVSSNDFGFTIGSGSTTMLRVFKDNGSTYADSGTFPSIGDNKWHHVAIAFDNPSSYLNFFVDGRSVGVGNTQSFNFNSLTTNGSNYLIGAYPGPQHYFKGQLDQVRVYNYARTPAQIAWSYNKGAPVGHWKMDECQGTQIADWSGNNNHGTLSIGASGTQTSPGTCTTSGAWYNGKLGKLNASLNFDGSDDYIRINNPTNGSLNFGTGDFSIAYWGKYISVGTQGTRQVSKRPGGLGPGWSVGVNNTGNLTYRLDDGIAPLEASFGSTGFVDNTWHHFVFVFNRDSYLFGFVDGKQSSTVNISSTQGSVSNTSPLNINTFNNLVSTATANCQIDDVRIYNYALTPTQIKTLYNNGAVTFR